MYISRTMTTLKSYILELDVDVCVLMDVKKNKENEGYSVMILGLNIEKNILVYLFFFCVFCFFSL